MVRRKKRRKTYSVPAPKGRASGALKQVGERAAAQPGSEGGEPGPSLMLCRARFIGWITGTAVVAAVFLLLKMFAMNKYAGDEHIYLYQSLLVSWGDAPYSDFAFAHPPLQTLFTAGLFKLFGYHFLLGRMLPALWCLAGAAVLSVLVRRELGGTAGVISMALYLLAYEPLRASSHYTGVNMTVALLLAAVLAYRLEAIKVAAFLCVAAVFTRLYAAPGVLMLVIFAAIASPKKALELIAWGAGAGIAAFTLVGLWAGFGDMIHNMVLYHAQKTPMSPDKLVNMRQAVLFHNAHIASLLVLAFPAALYGLARRYNKMDTKLTRAARLRLAASRGGFGLLALSGSIAVFFLVVLLSMDRVWMYYFIPSFPFAAVVGGWLISRWIHGAMRLARSGFSRSSLQANRAAVIGGAALFVLFAVSYGLSHKLEANLNYWDKEMKAAPEDRVHTYEWQQGVLGDGLAAVVKSILWTDTRVIGERYHSYNYYLWHESRVLGIADEVVEIIERETSQDGEIFGDSGTVPLFALLSERRIAANEVDTNIQRYRSGNADPEELIKKIDTPSTEMIVLRQNFGVFGVKEVRDLVRQKYRRVEAVRAATKERYHLFKRKP